MLDAGVDFSLVTAGGPVIVILALMSMLALAIILLKLWQFWTLRVSDVTFIEEPILHWRQGDHDAALQSLRTVTNPIGRVMEVILYGHKTNLPEPQVREEAERVAV